MVRARERSLDVMVLPFGSESTIAIRNVPPSLAGCNRRPARAPRARARRCAIYAPRMGRFAEKYTDAQRGAVVAAQLDGTDGRAPVKARVAVALAAQGELASLAPFEMPETTAAKLASNERRQRTGADLSEVAQRRPAESAAQLYRRLTSVTDRELAKTAKQGTIDVARLAQLAAITERIVKLAPLVPDRTAGATPSTEPDDQDDDDTTPADPLLAAMMADDAAQHDVGSPGDVEGNGDAAEPAATAGSTQDRDTAQGATGFHGRAGAAEAASVELAADIDSLRSELEPA